MYYMSLPDHYEVLQVSPRADADTIDRVFRHLAKRLHPDNQESGDGDRFAQVMEAFKVLSDPGARASYDAQYDAVRRERWQIFDQATTHSDVEGDRRLRLGIMSLLYAARRNDPDHPGLGSYDLERTLGCPEAHMKFHIWYLKENGWLQRLESGAYAITAAGVDKVLELGGPARNGAQLLSSGEAAGDDDPPVRRSA